MKRIALTATAVLISVCTFAQTAYDALMFSENEYEGTARTMSMGNAFTALGGDLGSVGLNPAGSAVAGYSQITFTPGLTFSASTTQGVMPPDGQDKLPYFQNQMKTRMTNFNMPNIGVTLDFNTGRKSGVRNITVGFVVNKTANFNEDTYARGINSKTSFMGSMAYWASGLNSGDLNAADAYNRMPWKEVVGYQSGMISTYHGYPDQYIGTNEVLYETENGYEIFQPGDLDQVYGRRVKGGKYDGALNVAFNISDFLYIGANLGITSIDYTYREYIKETAVDPMEFELKFNTEDGGEETIYFNDMKYKYEYSVNGDGYYGKIGVILTPGAGLRIGAAIQTPTVNRITEEWQQSGETTYTDSRYNASATSPYGETSYRIISPYRANFGLAYTLGRFAVVSADYELCDYSTMKYKSSSDREYFDEINASIRETFRTAHAFRAGAEIKPVASLAIRAGYGMTTSPEANLEKTTIKRQNVSFGIGYSSKKSFFADLAVRKTILQDEYFMPYADYMYDAEGYIVEDGYAPEILNQRNLWKVALTLGWRF